MIKLIRYSLTSFHALSVFLLFTFTPISNAEVFEVAPDITEWQEGICKGSSENSDVFAFCEATGGTPQGNIYNFQCIGGDSAAYQALTAVEKVKAFSFYRYNLCEEADVTFSGYGHPAHNTSLCWSPTVTYKYGLQNWTTGNMVMSGLKGASCTTPISVPFSALRTRTVSCPTGSVVQNNADGEERCYKNCPAGETLIGNVCLPPNKSPCYNTDNPCNIATGNKFRSETDFSGPGLGFTRYYNSNRLVDFGLGRGWQSNYQSILVISTDTITQVASNGRTEPWYKISGAWQGDADSRYLLSEDASGYTLTRKNGTYERYDLGGQLIAITDPNGQQTTLTYNEDQQLAKVTNSFGLSLTFTYKGRNLATVVDAFGEKHSYLYDTQGNLTEVVMPDSTPEDDDDNPRKTYHYEDSAFPHHLTGITDENGDRYGTFAYDSSGSVVSSELAVTTNSVGQERVDLNYLGSSTIVTDASNTQEQWTFDEILDAKKLTSKINQTDLKGITQTWDSNGNKLSRTDAEGRLTTYTYNATNQKTSMTEASGTPQARTTTYEYLSADIDLLTRAISPSVDGANNKEVINSYDANQNKVSVTINGFDVAGNIVTRVTSYAYDAHGHVTQIDGPRTDVSDITTFTYYDDCSLGGRCGQLKTMANALGHTTSYDSYDDAARLLQSTDANGVITSYTYHPRGWLLSITQTPPSGSARITNYQYDSVGQLTTTTMPDGSSQYYAYDAAHYLREVSDNLGNKISYTYDVKGNRTDELIYDPDGTLVRSTTKAYDIRNNVVSINTGGSITQQANDAVGNVESLTDPNLNPATQHTYDELYRLKQTVDAAGNQTSYQYNIEDRLTQVIAPNNAETVYVYDDLGNLISETSADRGVLIYAHDAAGNVVSATDARGVITQYTYDALNRLTNVDYAGTTEDIAYTYDSPLDGASQCSYGTGRLCEVQDNGGHKRFQYDAFGNVVQVEHDLLGVSFVWQYQYDQANRVMQITYPGGRQVTTVRDAIGRLTDLSTMVDLVATTVVSNRRYRGDGLQLEHLMGNGIWSTQDYDQQGRMIEQSNADPTPKLYQYDANGNITNLSDSLGSRLFSYDALDRLSSADLPTTDLAYSYDANSNRLSLDQDQQITSLSYQTNSNRLSQNGGATLVLDAAGNTLSDQGGNRTFEYNQAGRMSRVLMSGIEVARYEYDSNGLRIKKITPNNTTIFLYGLDGRLRIESDINGTPQKEYLYADGELVAVIVREVGSPIISTPDDLTIEATAVLTPHNLEAPNAVDTDGNALVPIPDNSGPYPLGETTIVWTATASQGSHSTASQLITIVDTTPPVLSIPADITIDSPTAAVVNFGVATASDIFNVTISNNAPIVFPIGTTDVTWTAIDENGNTVTGIQAVTVNFVAAQCATTSNIAPSGVASQSTTYAPYSADTAINGITSDFTHSQIEVNPTWELDFSQAKQIEQIVLYNRADCCGDRLRDVIVSVEDDQGAVVHQSAVLNPNNSLSSPATLTVDLPFGTIGTKVKVKTTTPAGNVLSLAEATVKGCAAPIPPTAPAISHPGDKGAYSGNPVTVQIYASDENSDPLTYSALGLPSGLSIDSQTGLISGASNNNGRYLVTVYAADGVFTSAQTFNLVIADQATQCTSTSNIATQGTATQSTTYSIYSASRAINGITTDFTHTLMETAPSWSLGFAESKQFTEIVLNNRADCCGERLRDIIVSIEDNQGTEAYRSSILNPENVMLGPPTLTLDLPPLVRGSLVKVTSIHAGNVLSLAEMSVQGCAVQGGQ